MVAEKKELLEEENEELDRQVARLDRRRKQIEDDNTELQEEERMMEKQRRKNEDEAIELDEEGRMIAQKREEHIEEAIQLDQESESLRARKTELKELATKLEQEFVHLKERQDGLRRKGEEENDWLEKNQLKHVQMAKALDEEKQWLDAKAAEQVAMASVLDGVAKDVQAKLSAAGFNLDGDFLISRVSSLVDLEPGAEGGETAADDDADDGEDLDPAFWQAYERSKDLLMAGSVGEFGTIIEYVPECINLIDPDDGNTLLHWAAACNELEMAKLLLENGAQFYANDLGKTPLDIANDAYATPNAAYFHIRKILMAHSH